MRTIWIIWKRDPDENEDIHAVCSTRQIAVEENKRQRKNHICTWIGKYMMDAIVGWEYKNSIPLNIIPRPANMLRRAGIQHGL